MLRRDTQQVYRVLEEELWSIRINLTLDHQIRSCDSESMDLLNRAAGRAFFYALVAISRDLIMTMARLVDRAVMYEKTKNEKHNCTFSRLIMSIKDAGDTSAAAQLQRRLEIIERRCSPLLPFRNRRLAHNDLATRTQDIFDRANALRGPNRKQVEKAVRSMRKLLEAVDRRYRIGITQHVIGTLKGSRFGNLVDLGGQDFEQLARCLKEGEVPSDLDNLF